MTRDPSEASGPEGRTEPRRAGALRRLVCWVAGHAVRPILRPSVPVQARPLADGGLSVAEVRTEPERDGSLLWRRTPWPLAALAWVLAVFSTSALAFGALCAGLALVFR